MSILSLGCGSWKAKTMLSALNFWRAASSLAKLSILLQAFGPRGANQLSFPSFLSWKTNLMDQSYVVKVKQIKVWLVAIFIDTYLSSARVDAVGCKILHRRVRRGRDQGSDKEASQLHRHQDDDDVRQLPRRHALDDRARHLQAVCFNTKLFLKANFYEWLFSYNFSQIEMSLQHFLSFKTSTNNVKLKNLLMFSVSLFVCFVKSLKLCLRIATNNGPFHSWERTVFGICWTLWFNHGYLNLTLQQNPVSFIIEKFSFRVLSSMLE